MAETPLKGREKPNPESQRQPADSGNGGTQDGTATGEQEHNTEFVHVSSTRFGELDIPREKVIDFPWGLIGFDQCRRFVIIDHSGGGPFQWLHAVDFPQLAFVITEPANFFDNYPVPVDQEVRESLRLKSIESAWILLILTVSDQPRLVTANLQGPIVINPDERIGRQLVLQVPGYTTRHPILGEAANEDGEGGNASRQKHAPSFEGESS